MIKAISNSVNSIIDGNFHKYIHFIRQVAALYNVIKQTSTLLFKRATLLFAMLPAEANGLFARFGTCSVLMSISEAPAMNSPS